MEYRSTIYKSLPKLESKYLSTKVVFGLLTTKNVDPHILDKFAKVEINICLQCLAMVLLNSMVFRC